MRSLSCFLASDTLRVGAPSMRSCSACKTFACSCSVCSLFSFTRRKIRRKDKDVLPKPRRYFTGRNAIPGQRKNAFCRLNSIYRTGRLARKAQQFGSGMWSSLCSDFWGWRTIAGERRTSKFDVRQIHQPAVRAERHSGGAPKWGFGGVPRTGWKEISQFCAV